MEAQSRTALGALSNLKDAALQIADHAFAPLFKLISDGLTSTADALISNQSSWESWGNNVSTIIASTANIVTGLLGKVKETNDYFGSLKRSDFKDGVLGDVAYEASRTDQSYDPWAPFVVGLTTLDLLINGSKSNNTGPRDKNFPTSRSIWGTC